MVSILLGFLASLVLAAVVAGAAISAGFLFEKVNIPNAVAAGLIVGMVNFFTPRIMKAPWLAFIFLAVMLGVNAVMVLWWHREGSSLKEMIPFAVLTAVIFWTTMAAAKATTLIVNGPFGRSIVTAVPVLVLILTIGLILFDFWRFRMEMLEWDRADREEDGYGDDEYL